MASVPNPRILVVTPEVSALPEPSVSEARIIAARAGSLGDVCAGLVQQLHTAGVDVHVAMPNYRNVFRRKIGQRYGALPVGHATGGVSDTVTSLDTADDRGNGFLFEHFDAHGLRWAIDQAMAFYALPDVVRVRQIARIMSEAGRGEDDRAAAAAYIDCYERLLAHPLDHLREGLQTPTQQVA